MYVTLLDDNQEVVYKILLEITHPENNQQYCIMEKVNHDDPVLYMKKDSLNSETIYSEIEDDEEYYQVNMAVQEYLEQSEVNENPTN